MMKNLSVLLPCVLVLASAHGQNPDSSRTRNLDSVVITTFLRQPVIGRLPDVQGTYLFAGKKNEVINVTALDIDLANKNARQLFARVPGVFIYDMDGAGNQMNIASRGLDPHRGWDFNIRKDGIITNSDMYGYPASHYSMPLESISRVEIVRGTGSLQYGAQFGGMLNYVTKQPDTTRRLSFESINSVGSYNLLSTYNAIGGRTGKLDYYAYYSRKKRDGYRQVEHTDSEAFDIMLNYNFSRRVSLKVDWSRSMYNYRIPGPLNDSMFKADARQATRKRNYFSPDIHVPSINLNWLVSSSTRIELISSAVLGKRNSVMLDRPATISDVPDSTGLYAERQVDIDRFRSITNELRMRHSYTLGGMSGNLVAGIQVMNNDMHRRQLGTGTRGSDYDLSVADEQWGRDLHFKTRNIALYSETVLNIKDNFYLTGGFRLESGSTDLEGTINYYPENEVPVSVKHSFPLFGAGFSYKAFPDLEFYGGWSQAYRPMIMKDLVPSSIYEKVDPQIKDAKGYNIETGVRTQFAFLKIDISTFVVRYNNRFGTLSQVEDGDFFTYRTNIGNSLTLGAEFFLQAEWMVGRNIAMHLFSSTSFMDARYKGSTVKVGNQNIDIDGNKVESAPDIISRNGVNFKFKRLSFSVLYSYTGETFSDALNTVVPPATGAVGLVPDYGLLDLSASLRLSKIIEFRATVNNLSNKQYFTKRPLFYPGPGVWPSEGRNVNATVIIRI